MVHHADVHGDLGRWWGAPSVISDSSSLGTRCVSRGRQCHARCDMGRSRGPESIKFGYVFRLRKRRVSNVWPACHIGTGCQLGLARCGLKRS
jgi:hypothetical protein